jgi:CspA family cold shock protein
MNTSNGQRQNGTVKWFNTQKGYGFIKPDGSDKDVFVQITALQQSGMTGLNDNQRISFEMVKDRQGKLSAGNLELINA